MNLEVRLTTASSEPKIINIWDLYIIMVLNPYYSFMNQSVTNEVGVDINSEVFTRDWNIIAQTMFVMPLLKRL